MSLARSSRVRTVRGTAAKHTLSRLRDQLEIPPAAVCCTDGSPPEAWDELPCLTNVALVVLTEPRPQELFLRSRLNEYPQKRKRPEQQHPNIQRSNTAPE